MRSSSTFVRVHGAGQEVWYWEKVVPLLERAGHRRSPRTFRATGRTAGRPPGSRWPATWSGWSRLSTRRRSRRPRGPQQRRGRRGPGHRAAPGAGWARGVPVRLPAGRGQSVLDLGGGDRDALIVPNLVVSRDGTTATVRSDVVREALFPRQPHGRTVRPGAEDLRRVPPRPGHHAGAPAADAHGRALRHGRHPRHRPLPAVRGPGRSGRRPRCPAWHGRPARCHARRAVANH